jgi:hypothetical protein
MRAERVSEGKACQLWFSNVRIAQRLSGKWKSDC